jgi:hypothetical protein
MPFGDYALTFALGSHWYGLRQDNNFFGLRLPDKEPTTTFLSLGMRNARETRSSLQKTRITITLYTVPGGNMRTRSIPVSELCFAPQSLR